MCKGKEVCPLWTDPATGNRIAATGCSWDQLLPTSFEAAHEKRLTCECSGAKGDRCVLDSVAALGSPNQDPWLLDSSHCSMCETNKCVMLATSFCSKKKKNSFLFLSFFLSFSLSLFLSFNYRPAMQLLGQLPLSCLRRDAGLPNGT